jgi:hypothetical protein
MNSIILRLWPVLYFFRAGEAYGRRMAQRELEARRMEARQEAVNLQRARSCWPQTWMQLAAAVEQIGAQREMISMMEQEVWMGAERLAMAQEQVAALDELVRLMLEGPEGLALGETYVAQRWSRLNVEREEGLQAAAEAARVKTGEERAWDAARTREMDLVGVPVGDGPWWVR